MIRKLQIKFVIIIMSILSVVIFLLFGTINFTMYSSTEQQSLSMLQRIADSDGLMKGGVKPDSPKEFLPDNLFNSNSFEPVPQTNFSVKVDKSNTIIAIISDRNQSYSETEVTDYLNAAIASGKNHGTAGGLKFLIETKPYGKIVVFLDNSLQTSTTLRLFWITLAVGLGSLLVIFLVSLYLSSWAVRPIKKAYEAQKRFVADASHELKMPITVISANADVLKSEIGDNKWLSFIKAETVRMNELVSNLLYLAKSDASENTYNHIEFNLSESVINVVLPFESACYESHKRLILEVGENFLYKGDKNRLMQVVVILLDNAIKNSNENGEIKVSLTEHNNKKVLSVYNTGEGLSEEDKIKIFDRFYRGDSSRARQTGGYGLGLSIAKSIVDAHKGRIVVESEKGRYARFSVIL